MADVYADCVFRPGDEDGSGYVRLNVHADRTVEGITPCGYVYLTPDVVTELYGILTRPSASGRRRSPVPVALPDGVKHGTVHAYGKHRCGCAPCRNAWRACAQASRNRAKANRERLEAVRRG